MAVVKATRLIEAELASRGYQVVVGIDEAGRGPLAGPVIAAAVYLPNELQSEEIADSKQLSPRKRDRMYEYILKYATVGIGQASAQEIDEINILQGTFLAMTRAVRALKVKSDFCLVDGKLSIPDLGIPQRAIVQGDALCHSIAAASIVAKVTRDRIMSDYDRQYPEYGFASHKGYPTKQHYDALRQCGPCTIHRRSFRGVERGEAV